MRWLKCLRPLAFRLDNLALSERKYRKPAIVEAVFELHFPAQNDWGISSSVEFANFAKEKGYPVLKDVVEGFQFSLPVGQGAAPIMNPIPVKRRIQTWNEEGTQLWQASSQLYAANRRSPYLGWDKFLPHILVGLEGYRKIANPVSAERLLLQYLNRIEVDVPKHSPAEYVKFITPEISYADGIHNFICQTEQTFSDEDEITVVCSRDLSQENGVALMLQIIYAVRNPPLDSNNLIELTKKAHQRVIDAFEKSITEKQQERMEPIYGSGDTSS